MPSLAHEIVVTALKQRPELLDALVCATGHAPLGRLVAADASLRLADPVEVHPDAVFARADDPDAWTMLEVQLRTDPPRGRRWLIAAALLLNARDRMGDVVVVTHRRGVADWSESIAAFVGPAGTQLGLKPIVVRLSGDEAEALLADARPELALFAAWCVHDRHGEQARSIVRRAIGRADEVEDPALRAALVRSILNVLGGPLFASLKEFVMNPDSIPESPAFREMRLELEARGEVRGEARGEAKAVLLVLESRGVPVDDAARERITGCSETERLERWIRRAAVIDRLEELFEE